MTSYNRELMANVVFVQLGQNSAPTLLNMAKVAKSYLPKARLILLTDLPEKWSDFPGEVFNYGFDSRSEVLKALVKRHAELNGIAGGYWLYTLERIFVLKLLIEIVKQDEPILHFESDVFSFVDQTLLSELVKKISKTAVPRYSEARGIGSILFSPSIDRLLLDLNSLERLLTENPKLDNDMDLFGLALNRGILEELPSRIEKMQSEAEGVQPKSIYDGLALGQYLFGQDPLHTGGHKVTGYKNPDFDFNFCNCYFELGLDSQGELNDLYLVTDSDTFRIANLHLHSKTVIDIPSRAPEEWNKILMSANSGTPLFSEELHLDRIHSLKISPINKIRRARKVGYANYLKRVIRNRMGWLLK
jgi:hypothetical protein